MADEYFASRSLQSRLGAWASRQSQPLASRGRLMAEVARVTAVHGVAPERPPFWGGIRLKPLEIEFWADGAFRLHDRFQWRRAAGAILVVAGLHSQKNLVVRNILACSLHLPITASSTLVCAGLEKELYPGVGKNHGALIAALSNQRTKFVG